MNKGIILLMAGILIFIGGCAPEEDEEDIIIYASGNNGIYVISASDTTGNVSFTVNIPENWFRVKNQNAEAVGVRIEGPNSVIFTDSWITAGESATADNINIQYELEYDVRVRFYEGNILTIIVNLINLFGEENGWQQLDEVYIRDEVEFKVKFIAP